MSVLVLIAELENDSQADIEVEPTSVVKNGAVDYDLTAMIRVAMEYYGLNPLYDISVDYWAESLQTFVISDQLEPWTMDA